MLASSSASTISSSSQILEGVQAIQEHLPDSQPSAPTFPSPYSKDDQEEKQREASYEQQIQQGSEQQDNIPEIFHLTLNKDFQGMLERFLTTGHEKISTLRLAIRRERGITQTSLLIANEVGIGDFNALRDQLYQVQINLFKIPKGKRFNIVQ